MNTLDDNSHLEWKFQNLPISLNEVIVTCLYSIAIGLFISSFVYKKLLYRFAEFLGISDKYGDENLYSYFLNTQEMNWIWIRLPKRGLTYEGVRVSFSETEKVREIVLEDVRVYN